MNAVVFAATACRQRQLAAFLCERAHTLQEAAEALGVSRDDAAHVLRRLPRPLEVQEFGAGNLEARYRVLFPAGRVCAALGCCTVLRRSNPADRCEAHGGGFLDVPAPPNPGARLPRLDGEALRSARERHGLSIVELAQLSDVDPAFLERLEHGLHRVVPAVTRRLSWALGGAVLSR